MRKALITGSSKGIGESIARTLVKAGYEVVLTGRDVQSLKNLSVEIGAAYIVADLLTSGDLARLIEQVKDIDILVNNAGGYVWSPIDEVSQDDVERIMQLNLEVPYKLCSAFSGNMKKRRWGRIINIGSISGAVGEANASLYSASKAGLIGMSKALALELAEYGVTANVINPGWVKTEMTVDIDEADEIACVPQKRFIHPTEVAEMVEYLCSESAKGVTGQSLNLCAGLSLG